MKTGFLGAGNMGGAILRGYGLSDASKEDRLFACDHHRDRLEKTAREIGDLTIVDDEKKLVTECDMIILGVKPQVMEEVLEDIKQVYDNRKVFVSMAAGISIAFLEDHLGDDARIIRIMPNTPAAVGEAMISVSRNGNVSDDDFERAMRIFSAVGKAEEVGEDLIDCVIGVSGSSPAYTYMYIQALAEAAADNGMDPEKARVFAAQSVLGAARMVLESSESVEQLRKNVCSPKGTTIEAVDRLFENGFMDRVKEGFQAAVDRSIEMTGEKKR